MARAGTNHKGGRPKGKLAPSTLAALKGRERLVQKVNERIDDLVQWLFEKARQIDEKGNPVIDVSAIKELLDRTYGRPPQSLDVTSKGEQMGTISPEALALAKEYEKKIKEGL